MNPDREAILKVLEGFEVEVVAGPILHDTTRKPITKQGALALIHALEDEGWQIVRK